MGWEPNRLTDGTPSRRPHITLSIPIITNAIDYGIEQQKNSWIQHHHVMNPWYSDRLFKPATHRLRLDHAPSESILDAALLTMRPIDNILTTEPGNGIAENIRRDICNAELAERINKIADLWGNAWKIQETMWIAGLDSARRRFPKVPR